MALKLAVCVWVTRQRHEGSLSLLLMIIKLVLALVKYGIKASLCMCVPVTSHLRLAHWQGTVGRRWPWPLMGLMGLAANLIICLIVCSLSFMVFLSNTTKLPIRLVIMNSKI